MNLQKYNPYDKFRVHQEEVIKEIIEIEATDTPNIILKAPVASGKSLIAYTVAEYLRQEKNKNSLIFTSTKLLQDQYLRDFSHLKTVKGRNNFTCLNNKRTCDKGSCKEICKFHCPNSVEFRDGLVDLYAKQMEGKDICPYWEQKTRAIWAPISIINYKFGLIDRTYLHHFPIRNFVVFDEAHNIEAEIMDFLEVQIAPRQIYSEIKYVINTNINIGIEQWVDVFFDISDAYGKAADVALDNEDKETADKYNSKKDTYKVTAFMMRKNPDNWVIDIEDGNLVFKPIMINLYAHNSLLSFGDTRLFMSGSILKNNSFCETLGLEMEDCHIIDVPSIIDPSRRPIYKEYVGSMSLRNRNANIDKIVDKILDISAHYPNAKGVVHTYTYIVAKMIEERLHNNKRFIFHNSKNRQSQTQKFIESDKPLVFVSPFSFEGVDFKGDLARFQIIAKNPFPNSFANQQYKERDRISNFKWIYEQRCKVLSQMYGRIVRDPNDYGVTYLIDSDIENLLGPASLVTSYFFEGLQDDLSREIVIVDEQKLSPDKRKSYQTERFNEQVILGEIKRMEKPTILKLTELYKNLPNDAYREVRPICERLLKNGAIQLI